LIFRERRSGTAHFFKNARASADCDRQSIPGLFAFRSPKADRAVLKRTASDGSCLYGDRVRAKNLDVLQSGRIQAVLNGIEIF
jgi:hypothetical protein